MRRLLGVMATACGIIGARFLSAATVATAGTSGPCRLSADKPHVGTDRRLSGSQVIANGWFRCRRAHRNVTFRVYIQIDHRLPGQAARWSTIGGAGTTWKKVRAGRKLRLVQRAEQACNFNDPYRALAKLDVPRSGRPPIVLRAMSATVTLTCQ